MAAQPEASTGEGWKLLREVVALAAARRTEQRATLRASKAAIDRAQSAARATDEAVTAARQLLTALMEGAGSDRSAPSLAEALEAARKLIGTWDASLDHDT